MKPLPSVLLLGLLASCAPGRDPQDLAGAWQNGRDRVEFLPEGRLLVRSPYGTRTGTYQKLARGAIRVDLGVRWPSGEPRYWYAMASGPELGLCELANGRHCLRFARPGRRITVPPR